MPLLWAVTLCLLVAGAAVAAVGAVRRAAAGDSAAGVAAAVASRQSGCARALTLETPRLHSGCSRHASTVSAEDQTSLGCVTPCLIHLQAADL